MSEQNEEVKQPVEMTEAETMANSKKIFEIRLEAALKHAHALMGNLSSRNIQRALDAAITLPIGFKQVKKFTHKKEVELAGLLAQILDLRTVLHGYKVREEQNNNKGENDGEQKME